MTWTMELPDSAEWSVCVRDAETGAVLAGHGADRLLRTASVGKLFLLAEVARRFELGTLAEAELLDRGAEYVEDSGLWWTLAVERLTAADLCTLIGAVSDNLATNVLLERVGVAAVAAMAEGLGCAESRLLDKVREDRGPQHPPTLSRGRADELSSVMCALAAGQMVSPAVSRRVAGWLALNADQSMVGSAFDLDPLAHVGPDRGVELINKTGTISSVRADVGLVSGPRGRIAYAALADWGERGGDPRDEVLVALRGIGGQLRAAIR